MPQGRRLTGLMRAVTALLLAVAAFGLLWLGQRRFIYLPLGRVPDPDRVGLDGTRAFTVEADGGVSVRGWFVSATPHAAKATLLVFTAEELKRLPPKWLIGYSDVTSLLAFLSTRAGVVCAHGPSVTGRLSGGEARYDRASLLGVLTGRPGVAELSGPGLEALRPGEAAGWLHGGNLTQLAASLGMPYAFDPPEGSLLLLEDVNERPYRIERLLTQLDQAGVLARARGLLFGEMPGCQEANGSIRARDVIAAVTAGFDGPVLFGFPAGHTPGPALTVPLGVGARLRSHPSPALVVDERASS